MGAIVTWNFEVPRRKSAGRLTTSRVTSRSRRETVQNVAWLSGLQRVCIDLPAKHAKAPTAAPVSSAPAPPL